MKEAAGEANITVITIVLIGVVAAVGAILIPRIMDTTQYKSCCIERGRVVSGNKCIDAKNIGVTSGWSLKRHFEDYCEE